MSQNGQRLKWSYFQSKDCLKCSKSLCSQYFQSSSIQHVSKTELHGSQSQFECSMLPTRQQSYVKGKMMLTYLLLSHGTLDSDKVDEKDPSTLLHSCMVNTLNSSTIMITTVTKYTICLVKLHFYRAHSHSKHFHSVIRK